MTAAEHARVWHRTCLAMEDAARKSEKMVSDGSQVLIYMLAFFAGEISRAYLAESDKP